MTVVMPFWQEKGLFYRENLSFMSPQEKKKLFQSALWTFSTGAAIVYFSAIGFCIYTGNNFAAALLGAAVGALAIVVGLILRPSK